MVAIRPRLRLAARPVRDASVGQVVDKTVFDVLPSYGCISEQDTEVFDRFIPSALNIAVWWSLAVVALLFVLPYFVFGGWLRGLVYVVVLLLSFEMEDRLRESAPAWFSLETGSASFRLVVAFVVFANALLFDWLFDAFTERKKVCPGCQAPLDRDVLYCSACGLVQPGGSAEQPTTMGRILGALRRLHTQPQTATQSRKSSMDS